MDSNDESKILRMAMINTASNLNEIILKEARCKLVLQEINLGQKGELQKIENRLTKSSKALSGALYYNNNDLGTLCHEGLGIENILSCLKSICNSYYQSSFENNEANKIYDLKYQSVKGKIDHYYNEVMVPINTDSTPFYSKIHSYLGVSKTPFVLLTNSEKEQIINNFTFALETIKKELNHNLMLNIWDAVPASPEELESINNYILSIETIIGKLKAPMIKNNPILNLIIQDIATIKKNNCTNSQDKQLYWKIENKYDLVIKKKIELLGVENCVNFMEAFCEKYIESAITGTEKDMTFDLDGSKYKVPHHQNNPYSKIINIIILGESLKETLFRDLESRQQEAIYRAFQDTLKALEIIIKYTNSEVLEKKLEHIKEQVNELKIIIDEKDNNQTSKVITKNLKDAYNF